MVSIAKKSVMKYQLGGTFLGFVVGVVFGLAAALAVAVYVTKVPIPFVTKMQSRTADQDAAEAKKNKDWDPNAPLYGKTPVKPMGTASAASGGAVTSSGGAVEPFAYFVQVGAFKTVEDAEAQRAKVSLTGVEAKVSEREQAGRTVFRVRAGPFDRKDDADKTKDKLEVAGFDTAIVRVQR